MILFSDACRSWPLPSSGLPLSPRNVAGRKSVFKVQGCPGDSCHLAALVEAADLTDWDRVCSTAADLLLPVVQYSRGLPDELVDAVLRSPDPVLIAALLHNRQGLADRPDLADRIVQVTL